MFLEHHSWTTVCEDVLSKEDMLGKQKDQYIRARDEALSSGKMCREKGNWD